MGRSDAGQFSSWAADVAPDLARFASALAADEASAGHLVQHTLARTYAAWPLLESRVDPESYARRVMLHTHIWDARRPRSVDAAPDPDDRVRAALQSLPPRRRAVVVLRRCEERSEQDAAALLDWSFGTVRSQEAKAIAALRTSLGNDDPEPGVAAALRDWYRDLPTGADPELLVERAVGKGTVRRRRDLQRRAAVFAAVCLIAFAGMVSLSRGGRRIPRFGGAGALITTPAPPALSRNVTAR